MVTEKIHFFDRLNPDFFNYGSLPIYLLRGVSQLLDQLFSTQFSSYEGMLYVGRYLSIIFDVGTVLFVYKISGILFRNKRIQLFSSFLYAIAFFPIQNSHFFVVDVFLTFFTTFLAFLLLKYLQLPSWSDRPKMVIIHGMVFAAMLATKFTALIFYPVVILVFVISTMKQWNNRTILKKIFTFHVLSFMFYFLFMPYAFISFQRFFSDVTAQIKMNSDPYIFPYTLQYVGTLPYLYYLKNIFLWGLGPIISTLCLVGFIRLVPVILSEAKNLALRIYMNLRFTRSFVANAPQDDKKSQITNYKLLMTFFLFYILYFLVIGRSEVKFMRYMLPIYPFFSILAGYGLNYLLSFRGSEATEKSSEAFLRSPPNRRIARFLALLGMTLAVIWTFMFLNIYSQKHSRIAATEWILKNIPKGSTIALEHWDDGLPLIGGENYNQVELALYGQPDDETKWVEMGQKLKQSDYIVIASNRLYVPLQKLTDCSKYKSCYPKTAEYYRKLFSNSLVIPSDPEFIEGESRNLFKKVAEFSSYPKLEIACSVKFCKNFFGGNWKLEIRDDVADESFTVYDHPKIFIFKKF